jgi:hypothetical protein
LDGVCEAVLEAEALDVEVGGEEADLVGEGDGGLAGGVEGVAEDAGEVEDGLFGEGGVLDHVGEGVEGVEQEVGVDLGAEGAEFRFGGELALLAGVEAFEGGGEVGGDAVDESRVLRLVWAATAAGAEGEDAVWGEGDEGGGGGIGRGVEAGPFGVEGGGEGLGDVGDGGLVGGAFGDAAGYLGEGLAVVGTAEDEAVESGVDGADGEEKA